MKEMGVVLLMKEMIRIFKHANFLLTHLDNRWDSKFFRVLISLPPIETQRSWGVVALVRAHGLRRPLEPRDLAAGPAAPILELVGEAAAEAAEAEGWVAWVGLEAHVRARRGEDVKKMGEGGVWEMRVDNRTIVYSGLLQRKLQLRLLGRLVKLPIFCRTISSEILILATRWGWKVSSKKESKERNLLVFEGLRFKSSKIELEISWVCQSENLILCTSKHFWVESRKPLAGGREAAKASRAYAGQRAGVSWRL